MSEKSKKNETPKKLSLSDLQRVRGGVAVRTRVKAGKHIAGVKY